MDEQNHDLELSASYPAQRTRRGFLQASGLTVVAASAFGVLGLPQLASAAVINKQGSWRWCNKCQGLFFAGHSDKGACPGGGEHSSTGSGQYSIVLDSTLPFGQSGWRWCHKCEGMWFAAGSTSGRCEAGNGHSSTDSGSYSLPVIAVQPGQTNWRWCSKCQGLWFAGNNTLGFCPAGGSHTHTGSGNYCVLFSGPGNPSLSSFTMSPNQTGYWIIAKGSGFSPNSQVSIFLEHPAFGSIGLESVSTNSSGAFAIDQKNSGFTNWFVHCTTLRIGAYDNQSHLFRVSDPTGRTAYGSAHLNC